MSMTLSSPAFKPEGEIPKRFTCDGEGVSPPLSWSDIPPRTRSLALMVLDPDAPDPDAPKTTFVHWVVYDIPPQSGGLPEDVGHAGNEPLPSGAREGVNNWDKTGYGGMCPPIGRHRYFFKLYALDTVLQGLDQPTREELEQAMQGHVVAETELMGTYQH